MRFKKEHIDNLMIDDLKLRNKNWEEANKLSEESESLSAQLAQKVGLGKKAELEDLSPSVLSAIEGGEDTSFNLLSIPKDNSVTIEKLTPQLQTIFVSEGGTW